MPNDNDNINCPARPDPRLTKSERFMLAELHRAWTKDTANVNVVTLSDAMRRCILESFNKLQRSRRKPEVQPIPTDGGGEARRGRPGKNARPFDYEQQVALGIYQGAAE